MNTFFEVLDFRADCSKIGQNGDCFARRKIRQARNDVTDRQGTQTPAAQGLWGQEGVAQAVASMDMMLRAPRREVRFLAVTKK